MDIYINSESIELNYDSENTLADVLSLVQDNFFETGNIVTGIIVDGEVVQPERLAELKQAAADSFGEVNLVVRPANRFAAEGLLTVCDHLEFSIALRTDVVDALQQGKAQYAMEKLGEYVQFWAGLQSTLGSACRLVGVNIEELEVFGEDGSEPILIVEHIKELSEQLSEVKNALESGDLVLLGDILGYEFADLTDSWRDILQKMALQFDPECE